MLKKEKSNPDFCEALIIPDHCREKPSSSTNRVESFCVVKGSSLIKCLFGTWKLSRSTTDQFNTVTFLLVMSWLACLFWMLSVHFHKPCCLGLQYVVFCILVHCISLYCWTNLYILFLLIVNFISYLLYIFYFMLFSFIFLWETNLCMKCAI